MKGVHEKVVERNSKRETERGRKRERWTRSANYRRNIQMERLIDHRDCKRESDIYKEETGIKERRQREVQK